MAKWLFLYISLKLLFLCQSHCLYLSLRLWRLTVTVVVCRGLEVTKAKRVLREEMGRRYWNQTHLELLNTLKCFPLTYQWICLNFNILSFYYVTPVSLLSNHLQRSVDVTPDWFNLTVLSSTTGADGSTWVSRWCWWERLHRKKSLSSSVHTNIIWTSEILWRVVHLLIGFLLQSVTYHV